MELMNDGLAAPIAVDTVTQMREPGGHVRRRAADALQIAAAFSFDCKTFVTNDHRLPTVPGLRVLQWMPTDRSATSCQKQW